MQLPNGVYDYFGPAARARAEAESILLQTFEQAGCSRIYTPAFEHAGVFETEASTADPARSVRFLGGDGRVLALPPDLTLPAVRLAVKHLKDDCKVCYLGDTTSQKNGAFYTCPQAGVEWFGGCADADIISLSIRSLMACGLTRFVLDIGHVGFFQGLMDETGLPLDVQEQIRQAVEHKDMLALDFLLGESLNLKDIILRLPTLYGGADILPAARALTHAPAAHAALDEVEALYTALQAQGFGESICLDLGLVPSLGYYTGFVISGYAAGVGQPLLSGGRYDNLAARFGRPMAATGFCVRIPQLLLALQAAGAIESGETAVP